MILFGLEEFSAKRRKAQTDLEDVLRPMVEQALDRREDTNGFNNLLDTVADLYAETYHSESGNPRRPGGMPTGFRKELLDTLRKTKDRDENSVERITVWLATAILSAATIEASQDDPEELFLEWVDMHDQAVRAAHRRTNGQVRPIGEPFDVDGVEMPYPGWPGAPIELWINCRCTLRPVLAAETLTASSEGDTMPENDAPPEVAEPVAEPVLVPWHGVLAPENVRSGDGRKFAENSLTHRDLPLPLTWQKISDDGHKGNVTVAKIEKIEMRDGLMRGSGHFISIPEADEVVGLLSEFGKFGVSVDADDATFEVDDDEETVVFTAARVASACIVPIPAFAEAWVALGPWDDEDVTDPVEEPVDPAPERKPINDPALAASIEAMRLHVALADAMTKPIGEFADVAPGRTEDGPGWLTHPVDTDRLRDYWVRGPGAAKIGWGTPGDFNRCRINVAKYVKPQHLNGYCANRHYDALGFWPGRPVAGDTTPFAAEVLETEDKPAAAVSLVASAAAEVERYPAEWFSMPEPDVDDPRVVVDEDGPGVPFTITKDGQVFGHVARWGSCHVGNPEGLGVCTAPPQSMSGYREFHVQAAALDDGTTIPAGVITVGGGHATLRMGLRAAREHYDDVSTAAAHVVATDGSMGIWVCGAITPWATKEQIAMLRSTPLSGDWRRDRLGNAEMIAAHAVNTPGFPVPRMKVAASGGELVSMVASTGPTLVNDEPVASGLDMDALAAAVARQIIEHQVRKERMAALAARLEGN